jgi:hypothetical protein
VRPISGGSDVPGPRLPLPRRTASPYERAVAGVAPIALVRRPADAPADPGAGDVELSIRVLADGGSITVRRRSVADSDGARRTVGIDAVIR